MSINEIFFELIRVAIGTQDTLSRVPSSKEWKQLYDMSKKQSLVGICFAGVQTLFNFANQKPSTNNPQPDSTQNQAPRTQNLEPRTQNLNEELYFKWMGMSAKIQHRNEVVNKQCVELQKRLREDGFRSCILKGQGVGCLYQVKSEKVKSEDSSNASSTSSGLSPLGEAEGACLSLYRQSGDIDVWVEGTREEILAYINKICPTEEVGDLHAQFHVFEKTEVEVHFTPLILSNKKANARLQEWFESQKEGACGHENYNENENSSFHHSSSHPSSSHPSSINHSSSHPSSSLSPLGEETLVTPSIEFNLVFLLLHNFRHYLYEGVGMRQLMDYYFVLRHSDAAQREEAMKVLRDVKVDAFAGALMDVLHVIFGLEKEYMLCTPNKKRGKRLLEIVLEGGNFGHSTEKYKITGWDKPFSRISRYVRRNWFMVWDYPGEVLGHFWGRVGNMVIAFTMKR